MSTSFDSRTVGYIDPEDVETIEMVMSPGDLRRLSEAAAEADVPEAVVPPPPTLSLVTPAPVIAVAAELASGLSASAPPNPPNKVRAIEAPRNRRWTLVQAAGILCVVAIVVSLAGAVYFASSRAKPVEVDTHAATGTAAPAPAPVSAPAPVVLPPAADAEVEPVQFRNPFDATEVFEFPPGTSETEARDAVAKLLLQRARDRRGFSASRRQPNNFPAARAISSP